MQKACIMWKNKCSKSQLTEKAKKVKQGLDTLIKDGVKPSNLLDKEVHQASASYTLSM